MTGGDAYQRHIRGLDRPPQQGPQAPTLGFNSQELRQQQQNRVNDAVGAYGRAGGYHNAQNPELRQTIERLMGEGRITPGMNSHQMRDAIERALPPPGPSIQAAPHGAGGHGGHGHHPHVPGDGEPHVPPARLFNRPAVPTAPPPRLPGR
jgi:hypothetical protein